MYVGPGGEVVLYNKKTHQTCKQESYRFSVKLNKKPQYTQHVFVLYTRYEPPRAAHNI